MNWLINSRLIFISLLGLLATMNAVFAVETYNKISYLDGVADNLIKQNVATQDVLGYNSLDTQSIVARVELASYQKITDSDDKISLSLNNASLIHVYAMLCDKIGLGFVPMSNKIQKQRVTLEVNDASISEVFDLLLKMFDLKYEVRDKNLFVYNVDDVGDSKINPIESMTVVPVKYANVKSVAAFLNSNLFGTGVYGLSKRAVVSSNPSRNELFVFGTDDDLAAIKKVLPLIDTKPLVNSFKVNHTTPKEMAELICESLLNAEFSDEDKNNNDKDDEITIGAGVVACRTNKLAKDAEQFEKSGGDGAIAELNAPALTISYFSESGKIGVYGGSVQQAELVRDFIKEHDKKQLMAYVEISVIELNESGSKTFSNTWNLWTPFISLGFDGNSFSAGAAEPFFIWGNNVVQNGQIISKSNNKALTYQLNYIIENGNGRVLSNPKIMVTNGRKATIDMTSDYIKKTTSQILESSTSITSGSQRSYELGDDEGIVIELTPFISPDGYVTMNLTPEFSTVKQTVTRKNELGGEDIEATLLQRRDLELKNVRIRDGESLVLAGLIKENETQTVKKMPILSDLPFVGAFFRNNINTKSREEMVIVVTPHIIKDNEEIAQNDKVYDL